MKHIVIVAAAVVAALSAQAHAGRSCEVKKPSTRTIERGLNLAERAMARLDASGAQVVVLARAGPDLSKYGVRYSHLGFAYRQANPDGTGTVWRVVHKLNQCATADSAVYRQGLGEFMLDDLWRYEAAWVVPSRDVQEKLLALLQDNSRATALHHKPYSIVSYAWGQRNRDRRLGVPMAAALRPGRGAGHAAPALRLAHSYTPRARSCLNCRAKAANAPASNAARISRIRFR